MRTVPYLIDTSGKGVHLIGNTTGNPERWHRVDVPYADVRSGAFKAVLQRIDRP